MFRHTCSDLWISLISFFTNRQLESVFYFFLCNLFIEASRKAQSEAVILELITNFYCTYSYFESAYIFNIYLNYCIYLHLFDLTFSNFAALTCTYFSCLQGSISNFHFIVFKFNLHI